MSRIVCWLTGHDWYNREWKNGENSGSTKFISVDVRYEATNEEKAGDVDLCFRCGKLKWCPRMYQRPRSYPLDAGVKAKP